MKNLVIISFFLITSISWAQEPEKEVKSADKKYGLLRAMLQNYGKQKQLLMQFLPIQQ